MDSTPIRGNKNIQDVNIEPPHPKIYYTCYVFDEEIDYNQKSNRDGSNITSKLHTQKAFVISSFYQFHNEFYQILQCIKLYITKNIVGFELEKLIHSLVFDIPALCPGMVKVSYNYLTLYTMEFELNPINKIPKPGSDLKEIIKILGIRKVFDILKYIILEIPVIVFSLDKYILANAVKSLEEYLFPFTYPFSVIEILPKVYYKSLEKLSCFIAGINQKYSKDFFVLNDINLNDKNYLVVALSEEEPDYFYFKKKNDKCGIILKDCRKVIKKEEENEKYMVKDIGFPKHYQTKIMKNINQLFNDKNGKEKAINDIKNDDVRYQFFYFFTSMLLHYKSFIVNDKNILISNYKSEEIDSIDINRLFKIQDFILKSDDSLDFFTNFMSTRIWKIFLIKNIYPLTIEEKLNVLLLDENIRKKKNKNMIKQLFKENIPFLETNVFDIKEPALKINIVYDKDMHLIEKENDIFLSLDKEKMELLYNQKFLNSNVKIKNLYQDFYRESLIILKDKKFLEGYNNIGYNINISEELKPNNENYTYKLWYLLICYNFKYLDNGEKWIMFNEFLRDYQKLMPITKKIINEPFLTDLMFTTFIKYGDKQMCSLLYKEFNNISSVKEDYLTFIKLHKKFRDNKEEFKLTFPKETNLKERNYNIFGVPKGKKMDIPLICICEECKYKDFVNKLILNFSSMKDDKILFSCKICHQDYNAKIDVSESSLFEGEKKCQLYTPKYLFNYIKNLGEYNNQTFYKEHSEIFLNLIILFHLFGNSYSFLFPYADERPYAGFDPSTLKIKNVVKNKYIQKSINENKLKWYENIVQDEKKFKQRRISNILPSRKGSVGNFKIFEELNSASFFKKKDHKKKGPSNSSLKYSKTINENEK